MKATVKAYAKINLMLDILSTLPSGYHNLFMIMQSAGIYDTVTLTENSSGEIGVSCTNKDIPTGSGNIAYKAAEAFFEYTNTDNSGLEIEIEKNIPHAAGLAGGSADAAAVIVGLNSLFSAHLTERQIIEIGSKVGSDVPFCAIGGLMLAQHTGTVLSYLPKQSFGTLVVVKPDCDVSTGEAYKAFDTAERVRHLDKAGMLNCIMESDTKGIYGKIDNVFEQFIDVPDRVAIKSTMRKHGALCACMSGSGPSVFGFFETEQQAEKAAEELKKDFKQTFVCECTDVGCEVI